MGNQLWSWALAAIGVFGLYVAGKSWWGWAVGIGAQVAWVAYALVTEQYGFLASAAAYGWVYVRNTRLALKQHHINREKNDGSKQVDSVRPAGDAPHV